jgi:hypothetical protein
VNPNGFADPNLPSGYAPFGIHNLDGQIFVTSPTGPKREDGWPAGKGFVDVFDTSGNLINVSSPVAISMLRGDSRW